MYSIMDSKSQLNPYTQIAQLQAEEKLKDAQRIEDDRLFEESWKRELDHLASAHQAKLTQFDQDTQSKEHEAREEAYRQTSALKLSQEQEFKALKKRHEIELEKLKSQGEVDMKIVIESTRDQRSQLERVLRELYSTQQKIYEKQRKKRALKRKGEEIKLKERVWAVS
jgi:hypothetical protein